MHLDNASICTVLKVMFSFISIIFFKLRQEKFQLEQTLEQEQEFQVNKLMRKIERLEGDVVSKQSALEQVIMTSLL